ncbi:MAG: DNA glycosylase AlkZ-like family protein, partial [bacterium]
MSPFQIDNRTFRRALLSLNGLAPPTGNDLLPSPTTDSGLAWVSGMVLRLGFVQIDSVAATERAHHHILFSRNRTYKQNQLKRLLEQERTLFENWTHDAAIIPSEFYPYWKHYFERAKNFEAHPGYRRYFAPVTQKDIDLIRKCIEKEGPLKPRDLNTRKVDWQDDYFQKPSIAKITMELLWRTGELAVCRRDGQTKVYDLAARVIPEKYFEAEVSREAYIDWACREALKRLGAGSPTQIARFFDAASREDVAAWCDRQTNQDLMEVQVAHADGAAGPKILALESVVQRLQEFPEAPRALRLLNPFDPLIHDRQRTRSIFGFDYSIEIWVPPQKRKYGYYVLPIL